MTTTGHPHGDRIAPDQLHVELILGSAQVGGTERQVVRLARELRDRGVKVSVVVFEVAGPVLDELSSLDVQVSTVDFGGVSPSRVPGIPTRNSLRGLWRVARHRRLAGRPDVSHAFLDGAVAVAPLLGILRLPGSSRARPWRHIAGVRGQRQGTPGTRRRFARQVRTTDAVVCNAPHLADEMIKLGAAPQRVRVIANGVDLPATTADTRGRTSIPTAVVVANFHPYKGHTDLVNALALLPADTRPFVRLCGIGPERDNVQQLVARQGLEPWMQFVDPPADVVAELAAAQFAIHPSRSEGLSNAILEQLAHGLPVITCQVGGNPVLVVDGVNGELIPPADPTALASAIAHLAGDPELRARVGAAARVTAQRFSWSACADAHLALYRSVSERGRP